MNPLTSNPDKCCCCGIKNPFTSCMDKIINACFRRMVRETPQRVTRNIERKLERLNQKTGL